ncbi:MAG: M24 family metallopeptidase [Gaiellaceae bacterium]
MTSRADEVHAKLELVRGLLRRRELDAGVLRGVDAVAWLTGGLTNPIERGLAASPLWLVVTRERAAAVTTNVEYPRLAAEGGLAELGFELHEAAWYEPDALAAAAVKLAAVPTGRIGGLGTDLDDDLAASRLALLPSERERLGALAADTAAALEETLRVWAPGDRDLDVQAGVAGLLEQVGAIAACLIVGGDDRVERFRHPLAVGRPALRLVMAVVVAERSGLHAAATRFACAGPLPEPVRRAREAALAVERATLDACVPGATYGDVLVALARGYAETGYPGAWAEHYQGGPVGYRQREFELAPTDTGSRWYGTTVESGHALAWNPSVAGGGKSEDTYLVEAAGLRRLTDTGAWPLEHGRPAVLDVVSGGAA